MSENSFSRNITRRDFLNGSALGIGGMLLGCAAPNSAHRSAAPYSPGPGWYGYGGVGDFRTSHGNTPQMVTDAHRLRDRDYPARFDDLKTVEEFDFVIVGCGIAGLAAGLEYTKRRKAGQTCLMLDNHPMFGGESKENEFNVAGVKLIAPQGANGFFVPPAIDHFESSAGDPRYYAELEIPREFTLRHWPEGRKPLGFSPDNYEYLVKGLQELSSVGHYFSDGKGRGGTWATDMWRKRLTNTPLADTAREELLRWYHTGVTRRYASDAEAIAALDTMSYKEFLENELGFGPEAARYADLFIASASGLGSDATSAYAAYRLPLSGFMDMPPDGLRRNSFPGGNSGFARCFLKRLIPDAIAGGNRFEDIITGRIALPAFDRPGAPLRMRLNSTVLSVQHDGKPDTAGTVSLIYVRDGQFHGVRAKSVVMATGGWMNRHVVRDMPRELANAYAQFQYAPFLVANVALTNWRFLYRLGITAAIWDKGEHDFGYTCNIRNPMQVGDYQPPLDPDRPTVLSFYTPYFYPGLPVAAQGALGRAELLGTSYAAYESRIRAQMLKLFGSQGFDPQRDVAGLILNRWGHAYSVPYPGFFGGGGDAAPRDIVRQGYGRIAFGHSELDGLQHYGPAADEGRRAFEQVQQFA